MKIRSITYFCNPRNPLDEKVIRRAAEFFTNAKAAYEAAGYEVQSTRLATIPFPKLARSPAEVPELAHRLEALIQQAGIPHASFGAALLGSSQFCAAIPDALAATQNIFFGGVMADRSRGIDVAAARLCAEVIVRAAPIDPNGFANLRFAALANVPPGSPFFPAAYHSGNAPAFAIATEAADLAVEAFTGAASIEAARRLLVAAIEKHARALVKVSRRLGRSKTSSAARARPAFLGLDFSLAPFPEERRSLATAFERLGVPRIGLPGSLTAAAVITECIDRARFPRTGFSGLMMPVLEDATLARRAAEGVLTVKDVLLYSAVCGTGLDTIPLPGDTSADQILPLLLDLSALALRLDKPLTARLMPVPGKRLGDPTAFDFGFFANSKVMALDAEPLTSPLSGDQVFELRKR